MKWSPLTQSRFFPGLASLPVTLRCDLCYPHHSWLPVAVPVCPWFTYTRDSPGWVLRLPGGCHTALRCWWPLTLAAGKAPLLAGGTSSSSSTSSHGWISMFSWAFEGTIVFGDGKGAEKTMGKWLEGHHRFLHSEQKMLFKRSRRPSLFSS